MRDLILFPTSDPPGNTSAYSSRWNTHTLQLGMLQWMVMTMTTTAMMMTMRVIRRRMATDGGGMVKMVMHQEEIEGCGRESQGDAHVNLKKH